MFQTSKCVLYTFQTSKCVLYIEVFLTMSESVSHSGNRRWGGYRWAADERRDRHCGRSRYSSATSAVLLYSPRLRPPYTRYVATHSLHSLDAKLAQVISYCITHTPCQEVQNIYTNAHCITVFLNNVHVHCCRLVT